MYFTNQKFCSKFLPTMYGYTRLPPNLDLRTFFLLFEIYDGAAKEILQRLSQRCHILKKSTKKIPGNEDANRYQNTPLK